MNSQGTNDATDTRQAMDAGAGRLGRRLALGVILVSALVTSVVTALELYRQYRIDVNEIEKQFNSINRSMVPALAEAVWVKDPVQAQAILDGLVNLRDVESTTVMADGAKSWSAGTRVSKHTQVYAVPLHRSYKDSDVTIGSLEIVVSVDNIYNRLWYILLLTLAGNAVKTAIVVFFMVYLFQRLVGRHLQHIARHVIDIQSNHTSALALERESGDGPWRPDILDEVVAAVNHANEALSAQHVQLKLQIAALRASEERYSTLVKHAPDAIFIAGPDGLFCEANASACEMFGYTRDEFVGLPTAAVIAGHETARQAEAMYRVLAGERVMQECWFQRKDGTLFPGEIVAGKTECGLLLSIVRNITERKETEEQRQKFVMLADSSSEFIGMCDLDMKPLYVNPAGVRMVGLPDMAAACRIKVQDYFFPEDRAFISEEFFPRVLREGHGDVEIRLRHFRTGEPIWMFYYLFHVLDAVGKAVGWATVSRDITERKKADEELRLSQKRFSDAFHASPAGMSITRIADGKFMEINEAFLSMFELSREEVLGHTSLELNMLAPDERSALIRRQLESGGLRNYDLQARTRSGHIRHLLISSNPIELAGQACHITTLIDVTDRKAAETALYESEARLRLSVAASNIGLWDWDLQTNTVYFSPEWKLQIGYRDNELSNDFSEWQTRVHPDDVEPTLQKVRTFLADPQGSHKVEFRLRHKDGRYRWIYTHADVLRDADGKPVRMLGCHIDITERRQAEEEILKYRDHLEDLVKERTIELSEANRHLRELDRLKSLFIASMSHELRTPLNSIIGFTGIILMGMSGEITAVQKKQLGMVKKSAGHLLDLINDVIDVSKIEAGKTDLSIEAFDLSDLALEVKESFAVSVSEKGLSLEWKTAGAAPVTSDRRRVRQILVNLIGNAVKFTEKGTVAVFLAQTEAGVQVRVRDTGVGMHPEDMEKLFAAFSRIHIQDRPVVEGTGLGLYLSRKIAALLGGSITAESTPGKGSEFTFFLPWKYPEEGK